jgi:hypothetical protein
MNHTTQAIGSMGTLLSQIEPKDWLLLVMGMLIPLATQFFAHIRSLRRDWGKTSSFRGRWHSYSWSRRNFKTIWVHEQWRIRRSLISGLRIEVSVDGQEKMILRGRIVFEAGHVLLTAAARRHEESWQIRFSNLVIAKDTVLRGVFLASDDDRKVFGATVIATQTELSDAEAQALLLEYSVVSHTECCVRVREDSVTHVALDG